MVRPTLDVFAATPQGIAFFDAYDALLARSGGHPIDVETAHGITRVTIIGPRPDTPDAVPLDAVPLVLLPGGGATSMSYVNVMEHLATGRHVIAVDLLGDAGRSRPGAASPRAPAELFDWLAAVLDRIPDAISSAHIAVHPAATDTVDVVGHSYGAMIALGFATGQHGARVRNLALLDPTSCFAGLRIAYLQHAIPTLIAPTPPRLRRFLSWETRGTDPEPLWTQMYCAGAGFPKTRTIVPKRPRRAALSRLTDPSRVTAILAPQSRAHDTAEVARRIRSTLPTARVVTLSTGTHHTLPLGPSNEIVDALLGAIEKPAV
ncbi:MULTISPECIES: alpha/beta fold hydrolase [Mycobacteriales]|uniref:Putative carboxylesterase n=1 Tax=Microbacterium sp. MA1 TaxID=614068 RepID=C3UMX7_9MICO|nr:MULTISPECIES: alpha/beta fold hydrolase [Mycobacteriales]ACO88868.1 putative carboxylesterase [Microbacterium sp. MA1]ART90639.1 putative carboxylesterase [Rhodococcus rhodochrous]NCL78534.1 hypothetical protein [Rhodococcus sp. YH1]KAF0956700.1 hypothetical protein MLGJGCBP_10197 [Rhodococcus sp. T7]KAF0966799.1 hypothetical protein MLGJGCBP_00054 [Rhodococcus sp. T7]